MPRTRSPCCACTTSGHAAALPSPVMNGAYRGAGRREMGVAVSPWTLAPLVGRPLVSFPAGQRRGGSRPYLASWRPDAAASGLVSRLFLGLEFLSGSPRRRPTMYFQPHNSIRTPRFSMR